MITIRLTLSRIVRCLLAAILIVGTMGSASIAAGDHRSMDSVLLSSSAMLHDCCEPEPTLLDGSCGLLCAQASCGLTGLPAPASAGTPTDSQAIRWKTTMVLSDGIVPEISSPPPRA
jgi:hypothetical protein